VAGTSYPSFVDAQPLVRVVLEARATPRTDTIMAINRVPIVRVGMAFVLAGTAWTGAGCGSLIGVDPGEPIAPDGGGDDTSPSGVPDEGDDSLEDAFEEVSAPQDARVGTQAPPPETTPVATTPVAKDAMPSEPAPSPPAAKPGLLDAGAAHETLPVATPLFDAGAAHAAPPAATPLFDAGADPLFPPVVFPPFDAGTHSLLPPVTIPLFDAGADPLLPPAVNPVFPPGCVDDPNDHGNGNGHGSHPGGGCGS
jgi:hypothetical protein